MTWKSIAVSVISAALLSSPLWIPHLLWRIAPTRQLRVLIVDYSVPTDKYRNHMGLIWLLNHIKIRDPSKGFPWSEETDYVGFRPGIINGEARLSEVNLLHYDWVYVADTYGVWIEDTDGGRAQTAGGEGRSRLVFGGLSRRDVDELTFFAHRKGNVILEFNTFDAPTQQAPREAAEELVGVASTGWAGCFLPNLSESTSIPDWLPSLFAARNPGRVLPSGPAMLFIHRDGRLALLHGEPFERSMPSLVLSETGKRRLPGVRGTPPYFGWFSIVTPKAEIEILAEIRLPTPARWKRHLEQLHIPESFPLLTRYWNQESERYYLAANLSNMDETPEVYRMAGLPWLQAAVHRRRDSFSYGPAYWQFFVPVMRDILGDGAGKSARSGGDR